MGVAVLSLSGRSFQADCAEVVELLRTAGVSAADVTPNVSVVDGAAERGCRVRLFASDAHEEARRVWLRAQDRFDVRCAHVRVEHGVRDGCVFDVFRPSLCPGAGP